MTKEAKEIRDTVGARAQRAIDLFKNGGKTTKRERDPKDYYTLRISGKVIYIGED